MEAELLEIIGDTYQELRLAAQARAMQQKALDLRLALFGTNHLAVASSFEKLSAAVASPEEVERLLREAMAIRQRISGTDTVDTVRCLNALGNLCRRQIHSADAEVLYKDALEIGKRLFTGDNLELAESLGGLGNIAGRLGDPVVAEANLREALRIRKRILGDWHPDVLGTMGCLGQSLDLQRKDSEAAKLYLDTFTIARRLYGEASPITLMHRFGLAAYYSRHGREPEAEPLWRLMLGDPDDGDTGAGIGAATYAQNSLEAYLLKPSLIPIVADSEEIPAVWQYTVNEPSTNWALPLFDDHNWRSGSGAFAGDLFESRTTLDRAQTHLWLRREFDLSEIPKAPVVFRALYGTRVRIMIYLNGVLATDVGFYSGGIRVLNKIIPLQTAILTDIAAELPHLRQTARWAAKLARHHDSGT